MNIKVDIFLNFLAFFRAHNEVGPGRGSKPIQFQTQELGKHILYTKSMLAQ